MAYKDSETLQASTPYALGEYSFNCVFDDSPTLGQFARASMSKDGQTVYKTVSIPNASQIDGWTVEANDTEATVYAVVKTPTGGEKESDLDTSPVTQPIPCGGCTVVYENTISGGEIIRSTITYGGTGVLWGTIGGYSHSWLRASAEQDAIFTVRDLRVNVTTGDVIHDTTSQYGVSQSFTHNGKTVFYGNLSSTYTFADNTVLSPVTNASYYGKEGEVAWTMIYGRSSGDEYETKEILVGRFAIDLEDAGGVGPGSDWTDPGDYDPDWEPEDPTHTLYVTVTGALSGRHNDPIEDPSYSYIPADKDTVKDYGCGGDGGHGGGGGAGASTVVIHKFATNQANSKEVTAIARRHGYGSGGGKGGKGGDGCILVYY